MISLVIASTKGYQKININSITQLTYSFNVNSELLKMLYASGLFLATIYNQSQLAERKHVAHYI